MTTGGLAEFLPELQEIYGPDQLVDLKFDAEDAPVTVIKG